MNSINDIRLSKEQIKLSKTLNGSIIKKYMREPDAKKAKAEGNDQHWVHGVK